MTQSPTKNQDHVPRAIEVGFPIVEINQLAVPERNSFKPIYQMHKWFARRASCVFRAIRLGALKPAVGPDGKPTDLMEEFYKDHSNDPDTKDQVILDPFMGGGTTVVEALRLGCRVIGIDLNPVAWFIVKTEVEPVDLDKLKAAYERLAERPVSWNGGHPLKETLLGFYKTDLTDDIEADVIYTFWVKSAICTDPHCRREVPLFKDYIIAQKTPKIRYHRDATCPACKKTFDWEVQVASLIAERSFMVDAPRGSGGEGRPTTRWTYAPEPPKPRKKSDPWHTTLDCPHCDKTVRVNVPESKKTTKPISLTVLLCSHCEAVWQWRGPLPEKEVTCPSCVQSYDPRNGNVPDKGKFRCTCGQIDTIIASIHSLPQEQRLPIRPYAIQAFLNIPDTQEAEKHSQQISFLEQEQSCPRELHSQLPPDYLLPDNGKFFKRFTVSDMRRLQQTEALWEKYKIQLPYPKSKIPAGAETNRLHEHHYNYWHEMFSPRQLLALGTLLQGIMEEKNEDLQNALLSAFMMTTEANNLFTWQIKSRKTPGGAMPGGVLRRHDFAPKIDICEQNVWGKVSGNNTFTNRIKILNDGVIFGRKNYDLFISDKEKKVVKRPSSEVFQEPARLDIQCENSLEALEAISSPISFCITDPPYVGNANYAELSDFFYVWLRLALHPKYQAFAPELTPKVKEIIQNRVRGKIYQDFYNDLSNCFQRIHRHLPENGLVIFTFHHSDKEGKIWEGLLESLCESGYEIDAIYPIHGEREESLHLQEKENISYDLIHVCRKRREDPRPRSWAGIRQEVRRKAREELQAIEKGRYGKQPLPEPDVRLICIGKCLELYSAHYGHVLDHENQPLPLHKALQDISTIIDQLVTKDTPWPSELESTDALSYVWLKVLANKRREVSVDEVSKAMRGLQVTAEDLKATGLMTRGRTGRGRTYEVKQPADRLSDLLKQREPGLTLKHEQQTLFTEEGEAIVHDVLLVDLLHLVIGLAVSGESVVPYLERYPGLRRELRAALRFVRDVRPDWHDPIDRVLALIEGTPLLRLAEDT